MRTRETSDEAARLRRAFFTRYDKLLVNFIGFVTMAAIIIWLK